MKPLKLAVGLLGIIALLGGCTPADNAAGAAPQARASALLIAANDSPNFTLTADGPGPPGRGLNADVPPIIEGDWYRPGVNSSWQWQLQGEINTGYQADLYDIDLFDSDPALIEGLQEADRKVICYFSAGSFEEFREDADEFLPAELGRTLAGYDDERWLDIRSSNVQRIMLARLELAARKGCDGVEPDNVDGYRNRSGFPLTARTQLAYNRFLANEAHARGLAVALKNDLEQIPELLEYVDLSVDEQCHEFDECEALTPFVAAGKPVLNAEYDERFIGDPTALSALCAEARSQGLSTLVLPVALDDAFRLSCDR